MWTDDLARKMFLNHYSQPLDNIVFARDTEFYLVLAVFCKLIMAADSLLAPGFTFKMDELVARYI